MAQKVLVVDVGGTHLKILATGQQTPQKVASRQEMTARLMCNWVRKAASLFMMKAVLRGPAPRRHPCTRLAAPSE